VTLPDLPVFTGSMDSDCPIDVYLNAVEVGMESTGDALRQHPLHVRNWMWRALDGKAATKVQMHSTTHDHISPFTFLKFLKFYFMRRKVQEAEVQTVHVDFKPVPAAIQQQSVEVQVDFPPEVSATQLPVLHRRIVHGRSGIPVRKGSVCLAHTRVPALQPPMEDAAVQSEADVGSSIHGDQQSEHSYTYRKTVLCWNCQQEGHCQATCPLRSPYTKLPGGPNLPKFEHFSTPLTPPFMQPLPVFPPFLQPLLMMLVQMISNLVFQAFCTMFRQSGMPQFGFMAK